MDWTEVTVKTPNKYCDSVAAVMQFVSNGIYIEDYHNLEEGITEVSIVDFIDDDLLSKDRENVIIHMYISCLENPYEKTSFIKSRLTELEIPFEMNIGKIDDTDWEHSWKKHYKPFNVGKKLFIRPEWEAADIPEGRKELIMSPRLAFGTGTHESTKMCLELFERFIQNGHSILDIGCGSGILSIAALLCGAKNAVAIDIDPVAVKVAKENSVLNNFSEDRLTVIEGDLTAKLTDGQKYDIIFANIIADIIIGLSISITSYMNENAVFICSGIIDDRLNEVVAALEENGLKPLDIVKENGWAAISAKRER